MTNDSEAARDSIGRRQFLKTSGIAALTGAIGLSPRATGATSTVEAASGPRVDDAILSELVRMNDESIPALLARQERRADHRWVGGVYDRNGLHNVRATASLVSALTCAASAAGSKYFNTVEFTEPVRLAVADLLKSQHAEDGTIDFESTNFHSPPDTAFVVEFVAPAYELLRRSTLPGLAAIAQDLRTFIVRAADGLVTGGVHTPNHRWAVCSALAVAHALAPNPRYLTRIDEWFAEKLDIDRDGQYDERSTSVYSPVVNRSLITIARHIGRTELLEPVRRNLEMTIHYVHPDGEVATEASRRQDRYAQGSMSRYYMSYRYLAIRDGNGRFAAMTRWIERVALPQLGTTANAGWLELAEFLTEPLLRQPLPPDSPLPTDYVKIFADSHLARIRHGVMSATILAQNTTVLSFRKGSAALEVVRFASAFFGKGQFAGDLLEVGEGRYTLRQKLDGPYYQPLTAEQIAQGVAPTLSSTSGALAVETRRRSNVQHLESIVEIAEVNGTVTLSLAIRGTANVPVAVELGFRHGGTLEGVTPVEGTKHAFILSSGSKGRYQLGSETIEFGPGHAEHTYTQIRGALSKWDGLSVYLTGSTPFNTTINFA